MSWTYETGRMNELTLTPATASWPFERGFWRKRVELVTRGYTDLVIDDRPLRSWFDADRSNKLIPPLSLEDGHDAAFTVVTIEALLGEAPGPYQDSCIPILICGLDNDVYCGAACARVEVSEDAVRWKTGWHELDSDGSVEGHIEPGPTEPSGFTFDRLLYERQLRNLQHVARDASRGVEPVPFVPPTRKR